MVIETNWMFSDSENRKFSDSSKIGDDVIFADLHIHSKFSRACSKDLNFENLVKWAKIKGVNLLGTGDFTHPVWFSEIKNKLKGNGKGFYYYNDFPFVLTSEISLVYTDNNKGRRVHLVYLAPNIEVVEKINAYLDTKGRRDYDGRPIFKISCEEFVAEMIKISSEIEVIPAHIWTPWFSLFGSKSGFDSLKDCFKEQSSNIHAIETGISSDPEMNWRISELDNKTILSFSDLHSFWPWRLGREVTIFKKTDSYFEVIRQIQENDIFGTIEAEPAYGKYHWDGHRLCGFVCEPEKTKELNGICPKCGKLLTIGVDYRVEELADKERKKGFKLVNGKMFFKVLPLHEVLSLYYGMSVNSKKIWGVYNELIEKFGNEFKILLDVPEEELKEVLIEQGLIDLILINRKGEIKVKPGYDGVYGEAVIGKNIKKEKQITL